MCVDYTGINKACPKHSFPLPRIKQIVDSTSGCEALSFLDAYSDYHQITMKESDQLRTSFVTSLETYCYVTMPFGLKNAGAMYQRCMLTVFGDLIRRTVEDYVDDIVVKSKRTNNLVVDLDQVFKCLRANNIKLNPKKMRLWDPEGNATWLYRL
jgi:hypothetical protein